jgi:hypothetical protein
MRKTLRLCLSFISDLFNELDAFGRFWLALGLVVLVVAARMSWKFGYDVSLEHAAFLACLTVVAAFGPMAAEILWRKGRKGVSMATAIICLPLLGIEFFSHAGYTAGLRGSNIETASVQNMRFDGAQDAAKEDKANLEMWKDHLAKLMADNAWAATVKADGLRAQLDAAQKAIDLEAARGGCKAKCQIEMKRKADLETRIAIAERATDLTNKIEATQRILDKKRTVAATTEHKSSAVDHQNRFLIKSVAIVANGTLKASEIQEASAEQGVNLAMALAGTGLPAFCLFMAVLFMKNRQQLEEHVTEAVTAMRHAAKAGSTTFVQRMDGYIPVRNQETLEFSNRRILPAQAAA